VRMGLLRGFGVDLQRVDWVHWMGGVGVVTVVELVTIEMDEDEVGMPLT